MAMGMRARIFVPEDPTDEQIAIAKWLVAEMIYGSLRKAGQPLTGELEYSIRANYDGVAPTDRPIEVLGRHYPAKLQTA